MSQWLARDFGVLLSRENEDSFHLRAPETRAGDPMPLKLCQGKPSCGNFAAVEIGAKPLCVPHAAGRDPTPEPPSRRDIAMAGWALFGLAGLAGLRRQKSPEHQRLAASGVNVKSVKV
jgi:MYXO-CTERM domain-containing protein